MYKYLYLLKRKKKKQKYSDILLKLDIKKHSEIN